MKYATWGQALGGSLPVDYLKRLEQRRAEQLEREREDAPEPLDSEPTEEEP